MPVKQNSSEILKYGALANHSSVFSVVQPTGLREVAANKAFVFGRMIAYLSASPLRIFPARDMQRRPLCEAHPREGAARGQGAPYKGSYSGGQ